MLGACLLSAAGYLPLQFFETGHFISQVLGAKHLYVPFVAESGRFRLSGENVVTHQPVPGRLVVFIKLQDPLTDVRTPLVLLRVAENGGEVLDSLSAPHAVSGLTLIDAGVLRRLAITAS